MRVEAISAPHEKSIFTRDHVMAGYVVIMGLQSASIALHGLPSARPRILPSICGSHKVVDRHRRVIRLAFRDSLAPQPLSPPIPQRGILAVDRGWTARGRIDSVVEKAQVFGLSSDFPVAACSHPHWRCSCWPWQVASPQEPGSRSTNHRGPNA